MLWNNKRKSIMFRFLFSFSSFPLPCPSSPFFSACFLFPQVFNWLHPLHKKAEKWILWKYILSDYNKTFSGYSSVIKKIKRKQYSHFPNSLQLTNGENHSIGSLLITLPHTSFVNWSNYLTFHNFLTYKWKLWNLTGVPPQSDNVIRQCISTAWSRIVAQ